MTEKITDDRILKLSEYEHTRLRLEIFLGSRNPHTQNIISYENGIPNIKLVTWIPAVYTAFREILDNSLDEVISKGYGKRIDVTYNEQEHSFSVRDDGRGIPIAFDKEHNEYLATLALTQTKVGRNFGDKDGSSSRGDGSALRGLNGVGASAVVFSSSSFGVEVNRDGVTFNQNFNEGDGKQKNLIIDPPMIFPVKKQKITGTYVEFTLSKTVFSHGLELPTFFMRDRLLEVSLCYPKLELYFNGERIQNKSVDTTLFPNHKPVIFSISREKFESRFWLVPNFFETEEISHGLVNSIPVFNGGTHIDAFKRGFFSNLLTALEKESKRRKLNPNRSDVADGMLIYNITEMENVVFDSQSKNRLTNENVASIIKSELDDEAFFRKVIRDNPEWIEKIYLRCQERTQKKDSIDLAKIAKKGKKLRVDTLVDACGLDRTKCTLFLTEGDSALSNLVEVRNPELHGALPLRGKVLNVNGMSLREIAENEVIMKIVNSIGLTIGTPVVSRRSLRFSTVLIASDSDEDGKSIQTQIINVFNRLWPELLDPENPFLYIFDTPLIVAERGKSRKYWFPDNVDKFDPKDYKNYNLTRCKGLGSLIKPWWEDMLANPKIRPIVDDGKLKESLDLIFNSKRADDRKQFMGVGYDFGKE